MLTQAPTGWADVWRSVLRTLAIRTMRCGFLLSSAGFFLQAVGRFGLGMLSQCSRRAPIRSITTGLKCLRESWAEASSFRYASEGQASAVSGDSLGPGLPRLRVSCVATWLRLPSKPANAKRNRKPDDDHVHEKPLHQFPILIGPPCVEGREGQNDKAHHKLDRSTEEQAANQRVFSEES
jgi:hypothetical protein